MELLNHLRLHATLGEEHLAAILGVLDSVHVLIGALAGRRDLGAECWISWRCLMVGPGRHVACIALRLAPIQARSSRPISGRLSVRAEGGNDSLARGDVPGALPWMGLADCADATTLARSEASEAHITLPWRIMRDAGLLLSDKLLRHIILHYCHFHSLAGFTCGLHTRFIAFTEVLLPLEPSSGESLARSGLLVQFVPHSGGGRVSRRRHLVYERGLRAVATHVGTLPVR